MKLIYADLDERNLLSLKDKSYMFTKFNFMSK